MRSCDSGVLDALGDETITEPIPAPAGMIKLHLCACLSAPC